MASFTVLGHPTNVLTLTALAEQARRICRASHIPLIVDADHGFGNALNVRRTVEELETAGVTGQTIEDIDLPQGFGRTSMGLITASTQLRVALVVVKESAIQFACQNYSQCCPWSSMRLMSRSMSGVPQFL